MMKNFYHPKMKGKGEKIFKREFENLGKACFLNFDDNFKIENGNRKIDFISARKNERRAG